MLAAEEGALLLEPVAENAGAVILAFGRARMNGGFEAVEGMGDPAHAHLERLVIIVATGFTSGHDDLAAVLAPRHSLYNPRLAAPVPGPGRLIDGGHRPPTYNTGVAIYGRARMEPLWQLVSRASA